MVESFTGFGGGTDFFGLPVVDERDSEVVERSGIEVALEAFGPARLIFGSDWPVCSTSASYAGVCEVAELACSGLSQHEHAAVLAGNARAIYRAG